MEYIGKYDVLSHAIHSKISNEIKNIELQCIYLKTLLNFIF